MLDYLNNESEEVKAAFTQIREAEEALRKALDNYRPAVMDSRYLAGYEVCEYLHISPRTLQTLRDRRQVPFTVIGGRTIIYPEAGIYEILTRNLRPSQDPF